MAEQEQTIEPAKSTTDKHLVAVVVFCEADGLDVMDAGDVATIAVRRAVGVDQALDQTLVVEWSAEELIRREVKPIAVEELSYAAANGHLIVKPTFRVYR